jgi:hypothetical protein
VMWSLLASVCVGVGAASYGHWHEVEANLESALEHSLLQPTDQEFTMSWGSTDGWFDGMFVGVRSPGFLTFTEASYAAMRDDHNRTHKFAQAIKQRLQDPAVSTVLDIGTGPYALLALFAARAGAKRVYAVEANPLAAQQAREAVAAAEDADVPAGVVTIIEGFSTAIALPERVDLLVAEIIGSVASEEGLHATIRDARARHVKRPDDPKSYIPVRVQTWGAPATLAPHSLQRRSPGGGGAMGNSLLGSSLVDWSSVASEETPRFACDDQNVQLLANPQVLEEIDWSRPLPPGGSRLRLEHPLRFEIRAERVERNREAFAKLLEDRRTRSSDGRGGGGGGGGATEEEKEEEDGGDAEGALPFSRSEIGEMSETAAFSLSGLALWPRLELDDRREFVVEARGPNGEHQNSPWQVVLPLFGASAAGVQPGDQLDVDAACELGASISDPLRYRVRAILRRAAHSGAA